MIKKKLRLPGEDFFSSPVFLETRVFSWPGVPQGSILGPTLVLLCINDLPDDIICLIAICADDTTLYSKCDQVSDLWQQLELASELVADLQDTGLGQEVTCWFQCWKNSTGFVWLLAATWNCQINYKTDMQDCQSFTCHLSWTLGSSLNFRNVASWSLCYWYYFGRCLSELVQMVPLPYSRGRSNRLVCMIFLSLFLDVTRISLSTVFFLTQLDSGILCL